MKKMTDEEYRNKMLATALGGKLDGTPMPPQALVGRTRGSDSHPAPELHRRTDQRRGRENLVQNIRRQTTRSGDRGGSASRELRISLVEQLCSDKLFEVHA